MRSSFPSITSKFNSIVSLKSAFTSCGAQAIPNLLEQEGVRPFPSVSTIKRILSRNCLTYGPTGYYPEAFHLLDCFISFSIILVVYFGLKQWVT
jgi:hypothetical protein